MRMSLFWRVFLINAAVFATATLILAVSPATKSSQVTTGEQVVLGLGLVGVLLVNWVLVRRTLSPLRRLTMVMRGVDLLHPGERRARTGGGWEVEELTATFNEMLDRLEAERRESARRAIEAQEQERRRVALELHDEVGQTLTGVVLGLDGLARDAPPELRPQVEKLQGVVRVGAERVREIARGLRPESLEELGLRPALIALLSMVADGAGLHVERRIDRNLPALSPQTELVVYRVAQESLTNVLRHAGASKVEVTLSRRNGIVELRVCDDGCGIDAAALESNGGLRGMRERAVYAGGSLDVEPRAVTGTEVRLQLPIEEGSA